VEDLSNSHHTNLSNLKHLNEANVNFPKEVSREQKIKMEEIFRFKMNRENYSSTVKK
jgi:predicted transcriptional regulator